MTTDFEYNGMTVAEAFELAGHPVPDDAHVGYTVEMGWHGRVRPSGSNKERAGQGFYWHDKWLFDMSSPGWKYEPIINLRHLPTTGAFRSLPGCVKSALVQTIPINGLSK